MLKYFVTYDVALKLKDVGFDMECFAYWETGGEKPVEAFIPANATCHDFGDLRQNSFPNLVSRPLWVQVFEWFFEKYGFRKNVNRNRAGSWTWKLYDENVHGEIKVQNSGDCESEIDGYSKFVDRAIFKINNPNDFEETQMERSLRLMDEWKDSPAADKLTGTSRRWTK